jgi:hypothetical protein
MHQNDERDQVVNLSRTQQSSSWSEVMAQTQLQQTGFPPGAYLIGAQKAGTTSLVGALGLHPQVELSRPKEPDFFTGNWEKGLEWYRARFPCEPGKVLIDASTSYSMAPTSPVPGSKMNDVPRRIFELRPDAKFFYLVRDPVDRAISSYYHAVRYGGERRPMGECMTEESLYIRGSRYAFQLERFFEYFSPDSFLILPTRELAANLDAAARRCWSFLGLDASIVPNLSSERRNEGFIVSGVPAALLAMPGGKRAAKYVWRLMRKALPDKALKSIKHGVSNRPPPMLKEVRAELERMLVDERTRLRSLTGVEIG